MSLDWLRLWHDFPNDPKWRVIARASKQPVHLVMALYVAMLVDASQNKLSRGVTKCHDEDFAVTMDCDIEQIHAIREAMQGRVLDGNYLSGWDERQPKKEDSGNPETGAKSAAERKREQRERERLEKNNSIVTKCHDESRNVTLDKDKDKEVNIDAPPPGVAEIVKEKPAKKKPASKHSMPDDFALTESTVAWANEKGIGLLDERLEHFKTTAQARGNTYVDWQAAFRNACTQDWAKLNGKRSDTASWANDLMAGAI